MGTSCYSHIIFIKNSDSYVDIGKILFNERWEIDFSVLIPPPDKSSPSIDWRIENWGCKSNADNGHFSRGEDEDKNALFFETRSDFPDKWITKLKEFCKQNEIQMIYLGNDEHGVERRQFDTGKDSDTQDNNT